MDFLATCVHEVVFAESAQFFTNIPHLTVWCQTLYIYITCSVMLKTLNIVEMHTLSCRPCLIFGFLQITAGI